jgi:uncharacterized membrane protein YesL
MFSYNSRFSQIVNSIIDYFFLSLLWLLSSLPVITIGASTTALYATVDKVLRREESSIWKEYWRVFRRDFKRATCLWVIMVIILALLGANFYSAFSIGVSNESLVVALQIICVFVTALMAIWLQCWFPYLSRFDDPVKIILKNTLAIILAETKVAFRLLVLFVLVIALDAVFSMYAPILTVVMPVAYIGALNRILERLFARYIAQQKESSQKNGEEVVDV